MSSAKSDPPDPPLDLGDYCRQVEEHLARVNEGHIVRIVGTAFELVRSWALEGIPLAIVRRGIEEKAERHRAGRSRRPLRLEFCEADVRQLYDDWRRAVGIRDSGSGGDLDGQDLPLVLAERRRPSATRQLDRAVDRIAAAAGRLDLPEGVAGTLATILEDIVTLRDQMRQARGSARVELARRVAAVDDAIGVAARQAAGAAIADVEREARRELAAFRDRLPSEVWERSVRASVDRLLRERSGLPTLDLAISPASAG